MAFIFFDFDETLNDFETNRGRVMGAVRQVLRRRSMAAPGISAHDFQEAWREAWMDVWPRYTQGRMTEDELRWKRVEKALSLAGLALPEAVVAEVHAAYWDTLARSATLFPDVLPVLRRLRQTHGLGILSNGRATTQRRRIESTPAARWMDVIVVGGERGAHKPDPVVFEQALRVTGIEGLPPEDVVMVGDSPEADIMGGRRAGWQTIWINRRGASWPDNLPPPDREIRSLDELLEDRPAGGAGTHEGHDGSQG